MILRILVMVLRIPVTIVNALWVVFGFITIFGSFGSFVTEPSGAGQLCVALWLLLAWPILNIIAIWWRTQSRARWRKVIPLVATIVNGLTIVFFLVFLLFYLPEKKTWEEGYAYMFSIWCTLNIMAIWCGRLKLKRKAVPTE